MCGKVWIVNVTVQNKRVLKTIKKSFNFSKPSFFCLIEKLINFLEAYLAIKFYIPGHNHDHNQV